MIRALVLVFSLPLLASCKGKPSTAWSARPQFTSGRWDVYHPLGLSAPEQAWIRDSIAGHIYLSESTARTATHPHAPRWVSVPGRPIRPRIYVHARKIKHLNSPHRIGVRAYADFGEEAVYATLGDKASLPGLAAAVHQLRCGPDVYHQDATLGWALLLPGQDAMVRAWIRSR